MRLEVRLFAACRERAGADRVAIELPGRTAPLADVRAALAQASPALAPLLAAVRVAVNREVAAEDAAVSGGSGLGPFEVRQGPITVEEVERAVRAPDVGAIVSFSGTVRARTGAHDVVALEYEAYREMAEFFLRRIGGEIAERWPGARAAVLHRTGRLEVGETSVVIAVSSPHRAQAFDACRHAIERIKEDVPIWKKEIRKDGSVW